MRPQRHSSTPTIPRLNSCLSMLVAGLVCSVIFCFLRVSKLRETRIQHQVLLVEPTITLAELEDKLEGKHFINATGAHLESRITYAWNMSDEVCKDIRAAITSSATSKTSLVCFDFNSQRQVQFYTKLTLFEDSTKPYLDSALQFLLDIFKATSRKVERRFVWALHDDASFEHSAAQSILRLKCVTILAHSVKESFLQYITLVPNFHFIRDDGFSTLCDKFENVDSSFADRDETVFWRGVTTGMCAHKHKTEVCTCKDLQRMEAVNAAKDIQHLDFGITAGVQICSSHDVSEVQTTRIPEIGWARHRGILEIDGNVDAWGNFWRMCSRSIVFKVESQYINYFSSYFKKDVHFIGLNQDMSDLLNKTEIVKSEAPETLLRLAEIATKAQDVARQLTYQKIVLRIADTVFK